MIARLAPEDGDVVVRKEGLEGALVYVLHTVPAPDQFILHTRDEAVAHALAFAKRAHLRAWFDKGNDDYVLLGTFRQDKV